MFQFDVCKDIIQRINTEKGVINKVKSVLYGPGWSPGKPRTGDIADIPQVETPVRKYNTDIPSWLSVYVSVHFVLFLVGYQELMARHGMLSQTAVLLSVVYCFLNLSCFGRILDKSSGAASLEMLRCGLFIVGDIIISQRGGFFGEKGYRPTVMFCLHIVYASSIAIWLAEIARRTVVVQRKEL